MPLASKGQALPEGLGYHVRSYSHYIIIANYVKTKFLRSYFHECQKLGDFYILVKHVQL